VTVPKMHSVPFSHMLSVRKNSHFGFLAIILLHEIESKSTPFFTEISADRRHFRKKYINDFMSNKKLTPEQNLVRFPPSVA
jgi:hypothetical protein